MIDAGTQRALIALGSNLAQPWRQLRRAGRELASLGEVTARSSMWLSEPVGGPDGQPPYLNAVLALTPRRDLMCPARLLLALHLIEAQHGRVRGARNAPRTLDLDLIDAPGGSRLGGWPRLPHPRVMERAFVLAPLLEVAPDWRHPRSGLGAAPALVRVGRSGLRRTVLVW